MSKRPPYSDYDECDLRARLKELHRCLFKLMHRDLSGAQKLVSICLQAITNADLRPDTFHINNGVPLIHYVSYMGDLDAISLLKERKVDLNITNYDGETPLYWAVWGGQDSAILCLKSLGASYDQKAYDFAVQRENHPCIAALNVWKKVVSPSFSSLHP